jgi:CHAD domain-containing protein
MGRREDMSFRLKPDETVRRGLKRIVRKQLRRGHQCLQRGGDDRVHEARKSVKKVRALVRLLELADAKAIGRDARRLRAAGRVLSRRRDADAVLATLDRVRSHFPKHLPEHVAARIRRELIQTRADIARETGNKRRVVRAARALETVRKSIRTWDVPKLDPLDLTNLLEKSYRAARKAMFKARKTTHAPDVHRWRKRVKTLWYQLRLLEGQAPKLRTVLQRFDRLETVLGEHHDLVVLESMLATDRRRRGAADARRQLAPLSRRLQATLRRRALNQGRRLLERKPKAFARALRRSLSRSSKKSKKSASTT